VFSIATGLLAAAGGDKDQQYDAIDSLIHSVFTLSHSLIHFYSRCLLIFHNSAHVNNFPGIIYFIT
jgi:hypothetical protein